MDGRAPQEVGGANARALGRSAVQVESGCITGEAQEGEVEIVSLSVEGDHSYVAGGIIVHNSDICLSYGSDSATGDGAEYDLDYNPINGTKLPYEQGVPRHWQCRSVEVAITKTWEEMGMEEPEGYPQFEPAQSGEDWMREQGTEVQDELLGPSRAELWRQGKVKLVDLLDQQGNALSVAELEKKYAEVGVRPIDFSNAKTLADVTNLFSAKHENVHLIFDRMPRVDVAAKVASTADELLDQYKGLHKVYGIHVVNEADFNVSGRWGEYEHLPGVIRLEASALGDNFETAYKASTLQ
ncbi:MAG TPA: hypothetical protein VIY48_08180, partial [Candidatus Paceibacterota bacterium]